jgi:hypothetical protein
MAGRKGPTKARGANIASGNSYRPCPWSSNEANYHNGELSGYRSFCTNPDNPITHGGCRALVTKDPKLCLGGTVGGRTYRNCPYYKRMTTADRQVKAKKDKKTHRHYQLFGDPMQIFVVAVFIIALLGYFSMK